MVECGEWPDLKLARSQFVRNLSRGETACADKGYRGPLCFISPDNYPTTRIRQKRIMARHETVNRRIRQFEVLEQRFRHDLTKHSTCFHAVVNITQLMISNGEPLFAV